MLVPFAHSKPVAKVPAKMDPVGSEHKWIRTSFTGVKGAVCELNGRFYAAIAAMSIKEVESLWTGDGCVI